MEILNRIIDTAKQKGIQQQQICNALEISSGIFSTWKKRQTDPPAKYIVSICEVLDVSPYYLLTGEEDPKDNFQKLTNDQLSLLHSFNNLSHDMQQRLIGRAELLVEQQKERERISAAEKKRIRMITLPYSDYKVSAGVGYLLEDYDSWDKIKIPETPLSLRADFVLTIQGDSMEPLYHDGDNVLVKQQTTVERGQIGIFIVENNGFIKKFGGDRLISLNDAYEDILFKDCVPDSVYCVGLVLGRA